MRRYIMVAGGFANGAPCPHEGEYLESFDHDADGGRGFATFTSNPFEAKRFPSRLAALNFWRKQSTVRPTRPDGEPNRPLTCLTVEIEPL